VDLEVRRGVGRARKDVTDRVLQRAQPHRILGRRQVLAERAEPVGVRWAAGGWCGIACFACVPIVRHHCSHIGSTVGGLEPIGRQRIDVESPAPTSTSAVRAAEQGGERRRVSTQVTSTRTLW
jgi:hypothetical protein